MIARIGNVSRSGSGRMVTVKGVRYRYEDAKRLGLVVDPPVTPVVKPEAAEVEVKKAPAPKNKMRTAPNKEG